VDTIGCISLLISCLWLAAAGLLLHRAFRQSRLISSISVSRRAPRQKVAVIVPARDERENIGRCIASLLRQACRDCLQIYVVDDQSSDGSAEIVAALALECPNVQLLRNRELPGGWTGKSYACWIGSRRASCEAEWLCFIDADVCAEPELISSALGHADQHDLDLLSLSPRHELRSFAERLLLPCGHYLLAFCQDLSKRQDDRHPDATVSGKFMLIRRSRYEAIGGHAAVADMICEDVALARLIKRTGASVRLCAGERLLTTRMYTGWRTLWPGIAKNLVEMLGGPARTAAIAIAAIVLSWAAVVILAIDLDLCAGGNSGACIALAPALTGASAAVAFHIAGSMHFQIPVWYGLLFPVGYTAGAAMAIDSIRRRWTGRVTWKGRVYS